jgi:hypothetical protein
MRNNVWVIAGILIIIAVAIWIILHLSVHTKH